MLEILHLLGSGGLLPGVAADQRRTGDRAGTTATGGLARKVGARRHSQVCAGPWRLRACGASATARFAHEADGGHGRTW
jgi:hypothetical protein